LLHEIGEAERARGEIEREEGEGRVPPVDRLELDDVGAGGDLESELLAFGAVEEVYMLLRLLLRGGDDLHRRFFGSGGDRGTKKNGAGRGGLCFDGTVLMSALSRRNIFASLRLAAVTNSKACAMFFQLHLQLTDAVVVHLMCYCKIRVRL
jgi:hypothetical protein